jgi:hypothetical protein
MPTKTHERHLLATATALSPCLKTRRGQLVGPERHHLPAQRTNTMQIGAGTLITPRV